MTPPDATFDKYPPTLLVPHIAELYGLRPDTVRKNLQHGDPSMPPPFMNRPWRWRKTEVQRHYNRLTLRDVRQARAQLRRDLRKVG